VKVPNSFNVEFCGGWAVPKGHGNPSQMVEPDMECMSNQVLENGI
jgi:hypothetical protein